MHRAKAGGDHPGRHRSVEKVGLDVDAADVATALAVDADEWRQELPRSEGNGCSSSAETADRCQMSSTP